MNKNITRFFDQNPKAEAAHVVLGEIFSDASKASKYKKHINAKKVAVITRKEHQDWKKKNEPEKQTQQVTE